MKNLTKRGYSLFFDFCSQKGCLSLCSATFFHDVSFFSLTRVLPARNIITVGAKRFRCGEEAGGFHDTAFRRFINATLTSVRSVPVSCRQTARPFFKGLFSA